MQFSPARLAALLILLSGAPSVGSQTPVQPPKAKGPTTIDAQSI